MSATRFLGVVTWLSTHLKLRPDSAPSQTGRPSCRSMGRLRRGNCWQGPVPFSDHAIPESLPTPKSLIPSKDFSDVRRSC
ncbi:unnamed protein product [Fusarium graminearum]|nr:unnamed protein product [Fusarium graminearum]CAG1962016.1 unnamed protein product [Fusarium graminearum]CAG1968616.1 unnamed protein product [Fusarium graminearum]VTO86220.1 unnamed protein product [Fusarium graminearum]